MDAIKIKALVEIVLAETISIKEMLEKYLANAAPKDFTDENLSLILASAQVSISISVQSIARLAQIPASVFIDSLRYATLIAQEEAAKEGMKVKFRTVDETGKKTGDL